MPVHRRLAIVSCFLLLGCLTLTLWPQRTWGCELGKPPGWGRGAGGEFTSRGVCPGSGIAAPCTGEPLPGAERTAYSHLISTENSSYNPDCNPWLTADEDELFYIIFDSMNGPPKPGYQGQWDIYVSQWDPVTRGWGPGTNLGPNINTEGPERRPTTTATGDTLFFCRATSIMISIRTGGEFGPATMLFPGSDPAITSDGMHLYFVRDNDIWVADRGASIYQWLNHRSIGPPVNTDRAEVRPMVSFDGTELYFSDFGGARPGGYGGGDLWVSTWTGSGWGVPANVGPPVNTDRVTCTPFLVRDGSRLYTASESFEGSRGDEDLWVSYADSFPQARVVAAAPGTWTMAGQLDGAWNVYDLVEGPDGTVYAATMPPAVVFRSADHGATWTATAPLPNALIAYSLLAATDGAIYVGTYPNGDVFRSTDRGDHWSPTANLTIATTVRALLQTSDGRILAGTSPLCRIYATTNGGLSWSLLGPTVGLSDGITTLFEASSGDLFAGAWGSPNRSTDGGATWTRQNLPSAFGNEVASIESFSETEGGTLWWTGWVHGHGGYVFRSVNSGAVWDTTGRVMVGPVHAVRVYDMVETDSGDLLIGYQPGPSLVASRSTDSGASWIQEGSLAEAHEILRFLKLEDGTILAATTPNGDVFRWTPGVTAAEPPESGPPEEALGQPAVDAVLGAMPNPVLGATTVRYQVAQGGRIRLSIVDVAGRVVGVLRDARVPAGQNEIVWNGADSGGRPLKNGVYFIRLESAGRITFQKVTLLRR